VHAEPEVRSLAWLRALASDAFVWGYPFVRAAQLRAHLTRTRDAKDAASAAVASAPLNTLGHARRLATPDTRVGVAPNNDTLYSLAWLDLAARSFVLRTPDFGDRYYSFQMGQADTSSELCFGQRTHGSRLPPLFIHGPGCTHAAPSGMTPVRSRYRYLMVAGRILVEGASDLPAVHQLQDQIALDPWEPQHVEERLPGVTAPAPSSAFGNSVADPELVFLEQLGRVLLDIGSAPEDLELVQSLGAIGLSLEHGYLDDHLVGEARVAVAEGLRDGRSRVRAKTLDLGRRANGWSINDRGASFGADHLLRAAVAMDQIYSVEAAEALYPSARVDHLGEVLDGRRRYRIRFEADNLPPVRAFWSITLYFARGFLVPNPIDRWSIGDRTPGLTRAPDGALEIVVQHARPEDTRANWLPAPPGPFMLLMRLYHPYADASDGAWVPPPVMRLLG